MRGIFLAGFALFGLVTACSGATTRNPKPSLGEAGESGLGSAGEPAVEQPSAGQPAVVPTGPACDCVAHDIGWWREGDTEATRRESHLQSCNVYTYSEGPVDETVTQLCTSLLDGCSGSFGIDDINVALAHPDVQDALERAPVLFGADTRLGGGQVDHIEVDGKVIEIGSRCEAGPGCEIPDGIYTFTHLLGNTQLQEIYGQRCEIQRP